MISVRTVVSEMDIRIRVCRLRPFSFSSSFLRTILFFYFTRCYFTLWNCFCKNSSLCLCQHRYPLTSTSHFQICSGATSIPCHHRGKRYGDLFFSTYMFELAYDGKNLHHFFPALGSKPITLKTNSDCQTQVANASSLLKIS